MKVVGGGGDGKRRRGREELEGGRKAKERWVGTRRKMTSRIMLAALPFCSYHYRVPVENSRGSRGKYRAGKTIACAVAAFFFAFFFSFLFFPEPTGEHRARFVALIPVTNAKFSHSDIHPS